MNKLVSRLFISLSLVSLVFLGAQAVNKTSALSGSSWQAGDIIDDHLFFDGDAMSVSEIQAFLNTLVPSCDTWGKKMYNSTQTRAQFGTSQGTPPPYICVKNYYENPTTHATNFNSKATIPSGAQSAAQIIYNAARDFNINPRVLLVTIKKEAADNLIEDDWPWLRQYRSALGFGCPDTAACDSQYYGFYNQVRNAAKQFRLYADYPDSYRRKAGETYAIQYHPFNSCASPNVRIENQATAGLYNYTPYQPNSAALNNLYGTGDNCSSYGNRNFWRVWNDWFGPTHKPWEVAIPARYDLLSEDAKTTLGAAVGSIKCTLVNNGCYQKYEGGAIVWRASTGAWESYGPIRERWAALGYQDGSLGYPVGALKTLSGGGSYQKYEYGYIIGNDTTGYWESKGSIRTYWATLGYQDGSLGYPIGPEKQMGESGYYQAYEHGYIIGNKLTGYWESQGPIRERWATLGYQNSELGLPTGPVKCILKDSGCYQSYAGGAIVWSATTGAWESKNKIRSRWGALGYENGILGYPVGPEKSLSSGGYYQKYEHGYIIGRKSTGYWESYGPIRDKWAALGYENGSLGYPQGPVTGIDLSTVYQQYQKKRIYYHTPSMVWVAP